MNELTEFLVCMKPLRICLDFPLRFGQFAQISLTILLFFAVPGLAAQALWNSVGPAGGDARAFAAVPGQPDHLYLGTTDSWLYESLDGGASWHRLSKLDSSDDLILDHIVVDPVHPATLYVAAWRLDHPGGGLWISQNGGRSWSQAEGLRGQSIRAFAQAPSDPRMLFAGTLEGVFRSTDAGVTWTLISPPGSHEIHEIESLAIDPRNPEIVYAGTWHLPWKTADGGKTWSNIKRGVIVDSDVFSILVDPLRPRIVYASACSGIYKSENAGLLFHKIQGIPSEARRTRVLKQDPANTAVVYAGTTEGLYKTVNAGKTFRRMTDSDVIVNDVYVDPVDSNRVLLATDRSGVLLSTNGGESFAQSNRGFSERKVEALLVDDTYPPRIFAGVVNDKIYGGAFVSLDGGGSWTQIDKGLDGRDVFALAEAPDGTILAGTNQGIFALSAKAADYADAHWTPRNTIANTRFKLTVETHFGVRVHAEKQVKEKLAQMDGRVYALDLSSDNWLASTIDGLFVSKNKGATWQGGPAMGADDYLSVATHGLVMAAARQEGIVLSEDGGQTWMPLPLPLMLTRIHSVAFSADGTLWLGAREGVYFTRNLGKTWMWVHRLPLGAVDDLYYDAQSHKILISSESSDQIYLLDPKTLAWTWTETGYRIGVARAAGDRLVAASLFDGVLVQPRKAGVEIGEK